MNKRMVTSAAVALMLAGGSAFAAQHGVDPAAQPGQPGVADQQAAQPGAAPQQPGMAQPGMAQHQTIITSDRLLDKDVQGAQGENIGTLDTLVIDLQTGQVQGAVVSVGGFLGIGDKQVMVPWDQMQIAQDQITTQQTRDQLEQAQAWEDPGAQTAAQPGMTGQQPGQTGQPGTAPGATPGAGGTTR